MSQGSLWCAALGPRWKRQRKSAFSDERTPRGSKGRDHGKRSRNSTSSGNRVFRKSGRRPPGGERGGGEAQRLSWGLVCEIGETTKTRSLSHGRRPGFPVMEYGSVLHKLSLFPPRNHIQTSHRHSEIPVRLRIRTQAQTRPVSLPE